MRQRWYDATLQRFISRDLIKKPNRYYYASDNPVSIIDPSGTDVVTAEYELNPGNTGDYSTDDFSSINPDAINFLVTVLDAILTGASAIAAASELGANPVLDAATVALAGSLEARLGLAGVSALGAGRLANDLAYQARSSTSGASGPSTGAAGQSKCPYPQSFARISINGRTRIPDIMRLLSQIMGDVKNVQNLSLTRQMQDFIDIFRQYQASNPDWQFQLFVNTTTKISGPLQELLDQIGAVVIRFK
jgi:hypothetical protein